MSPDEATRARMDGDYMPPIRSEPTQALPVPAWDPPQTPSPTGEG